MTNSLLVAAERNVRLHALIRIFAKRVFLPLTAIYMVEYVGLSVVDIGYLSAFFSLTQLLMEIPTGYFADRLGKVLSLRIGAILALLATLCYVFLHQRLGIYLGVFLEALGYSFMGGAGEALTHDSLAVQGKDHEYTKIVSRAQSYSLIINAILITLVPMSYAVDPRAPFLIGTLAYLILAGTTVFMRDMPAAKAEKVTHQLPSPLRLLRRPDLLLFAFSFGAVAALYTTPSDYLNLTLKDLGLRPDLIGWVYGAASVVGALVGTVAHHLKRMPLGRYLVLDLGALLFIYIAAFSQNVPFLIFAMVMGIALWRYRRIIYQDYLLSKYHTGLKATLISALNNVEQISAVWLPLLFTLAIHQVGLTRGLSLMGLFTLAMIPLYVYACRRFFGRV